MLRCYIDVLTGIPGRAAGHCAAERGGWTGGGGAGADLKQGVEMGAEAIDSGQAAVTLEKLRQFGAKHSTVQ